MKQKIYAVIKVLSIGLIGCAIAFELWNLVIAPDWAMFPAFLPKLIWLGRVVMATHLVEAVAAVVMVRSRPELSSEFSALSYGFYTFWVGTVGLQELGDRQELG